MKEKNGEHPWGDSGQLLLLAVFLTVWIADSFVLHRTTSLTALFPLSIRLLILAIIVVAAVRLIQSGHRAVGHDGNSPVVITSGAFHYVRHPLYLGSMLFYLGLTVVTASFASVAWCVVIFFFYNFIARYEEKLLLKKFGERYRMYRERTGKWVPKLGCGSAA